MGGPLKNTNGATHGLRSRRLPRGCRYINLEVQRLRRAVERAVIEVHGEIDIEKACLIDTAMKHETHSQLALKWLRKEHDKLSPADRLNFSREVALAGDRRDACIKKLGLDKEVDPLMSLYLGNSLRDSLPHSPNTNGTHTHPGEDQGPENAVCAICDGEGLSGRPCPSCRTVAEK